MNARIPLSAIVMTKDEEANVAECHCALARGFYYWQIGIKGLEVRAIRDRR